MQDDFSALDLLSIGGLRLTSVPPQGPARKKRRFARHKSPSSGKRSLVNLLPLLGTKKRKPLGGLRGWPMTLSWPTKEFTLPDLSVDSLDRPSESDLRSA